MMMVVGIESPRRVRVRCLGTALTNDDRLCHTEKGAEKEAARQQTKYFVDNHIPARHRQSSLTFTI